MITFAEAKSRKYPDISNEKLTDVQGDEIRQIALSSFAEQSVHKNTQGDKTQVDFTIGRDRNIQMKCDMCGKTFTIGQLTHDTNFGWVCKKCEEEETC